MWWSLVWTFVSTFIGKLLRKPAEEKLGQLEEQNKTQTETIEEVRKAHEMDINKPDPATVILYTDTWKRPS